MALTKPDARASAHLLEGLHRLRHRRARGHAGVEELVGPHAQRGQHPVLHRVQLAVREAGDGVVQRELPPGGAVGQLRGERRRPAGPSAETRTARVEHHVEVRVRGAHAREHLDGEGAGAHSSSWVIMSTSCSSVSRRRGQGGEGEGLQAVLQHVAVAALGGGAALHLQPLGAGPGGQRPRRQLAREPIGDLLPHQRPREQVRRGRLLRAPAERLLLSRPWRACPRPPCGPASCRRRRPPPCGPAPSREPRRALRLAAQRLRLPAQAPRAFARSRPSVNSPWAKRSRAWRYGSKPLPEQLRRAGLLHHGLLGARPVQVDLDGGHAHRLQRIPQRVTSRRGPRGSPPRRPRSCARRASVSMSTPSWLDWTIFSSRPWLVASARSALLRSSNRPPGRALSLTQEVQVRPVQHQEFHAHPRLSFRSFQQRSALALQPGPRTAGCPAPACGPRGSPPRSSPACPPAGPPAGRASPRRTPPRGPPGPPPAPSPARPAPVPTCTRCTLSRAPLSAGVGARPRA